MKKYVFLLLILSAILASFKRAFPQRQFPLEMPDWAKNANIYEVNVRQFSPEGTFKGLDSQLNRLKAMGVDVLWLMPIYPISKEKRKGGVGSHYAVADYTAVNPEYGTLEDFKTLVDHAHTLEMRVILDWVPNHTGWDHPWITEHPDWYTKKNGAITEPLNEDGSSTGWTDVADLDYDNADMRAAMTTALEFWVQETDIDGYRMDVAGFVPYDFWDKLRPQLHKSKQLFMLAEWETPELFKNKAFDICYGWEFHHLMKKINEGKSSANAIDTLLARERRLYGDGLKMRFTNNHDENSWNGTERELFGEQMNTYFVLCAMIDGMPLIYNGQESNLDRRLAFFEKDPIEWKNYGRTGFFRTLLEVKHKHPALWNGKHGGRAERIHSNHDAEVYAFGRRKGGDRVVTILNLSAEPQDVTLRMGKYTGTYTNIFGGAASEFRSKTRVRLSPWEYRVLVVE